MPSELYIDEKPSVTETPERVLCTDTISTHAKAPCKTWGRLHAW